MLRVPVWPAAAALALIATACNMGPHSPAGFRLPASGDVERGKAAFVAFECQSCHEVSGVAFEGARDPLVNYVKLGGEVPKQITDGYLVTAIINPSHVLAGYSRDTVTVAGGVSRMPDFTRKMSVRQLTDIVAFLQSRYAVSMAVRTPPLL